MEQRRYDKALEHQRAALAILEGNTGPAHPSVGLELNNIGLTLTYADRPREALPYFERARAVFVEAVGPEHMDIAMVDHNLGLAYKDLKDTRQAEARLRAAIEMRAKLAPAHPELARSMSQLAAVWTISKRYEPAAELLGKAIAIFEKAHGPDSITLARPLLDLGWIRNQQGQPADAIAPLERALALHEKTEPTAPRVPHVRFELAKALWATHRDRARAGELAKSARGAFDSQTQKDDIRAIDIWLAARR
jgi:tetratricopeptide (TPR) repeat protein